MRDSATIIFYDESSEISPYEASRLLAQSSFGATWDAIEEVQSLGIEGWIDTQMALAPTLMQPIAEMVDAIDEDDTTVSWRHQDEQVAWWS